MAKKNSNKTNDYDLHSFENSLQKLEQIVHTMEEQTLTLEESMDYFSQGVQIVKECQKVLNQAEQQVKILSEED